MSTYRYQEPPRRTFNVLEPGDYQAVIAAAEEPYEKNGKQILKTTLAIQPSGQTVFYYAWTGQTAAGEYRDNIGELLLAANRAPAVGKEPNWSSLVGAKVKVRLKVEPDQNSDDRNVIHFVYTPKQIGPQAQAPQNVSKSQFDQARQQAAKNAGLEHEPTDIPF
jgi:hypothetical protein